MTNHYLFGVFILTPYRNIVHIILALMAAFALTPAGAQGMNV